MSDSAPGDVTQLLAQSCAYSRAQQTWRTKPIRRATAVRPFRSVAAQARAAGLRDTAWDAELIAAEISPIPDAKIRVQQIRRDAADAGILRIAQLQPPPR